MESTILYAATSMAMFNGTAKAGLRRENGQRGVGQQSCVNGEQTMGLDLGSHDQ